ncbi:MAG: heme ABC exporter ATP-binding protein CcmA [Caulobacteraceae bacterium]|nr:heme ABC exporter ATP-binding protein CcmA [Caulobacteraceae bacterium]
MISALSVQNLAIARGDRLLFEHLTLSLGAGEAVALVGRNGAGKTSLLRAVAGLIRPLAGDVAFLGPAGPLPAEDARCQGLHLVGHHDGLKSSRTAFEELLFQVRWTGGSLASAEAACERLGLNRLRGLEVRKLSAGQRRRVALARLIAAPRPLWLLDEPLAPLDAEQRALFGTLMDEHLAGGGLIVAAVHDPLPVAARAVEIGA